MKINILSSFVVALLALAPLADAQSLLMSQSMDNTTITLGNTVSCNTGGGGAPQYHVANSYFREYTLQAEGVGFPIDVTCIRFGVEFALAGAAVPNPGFQPVEIRLNIQQSATVFPAPPTSLNLVHTEMFQVADVPATANGVILTQGMNPPVTVLPNETLVVELYLPDGTVMQNVLFPASNQNGETAPAYLMSAGCNVTTPMPINSLTASGSPPIHLILDVGYVPAGSTLSPQLAISQPGGAGSGMVIVNSDLRPGHQIWNFYSFDLGQPAGAGPYLGLAFNNPFVSLFPQFMTPLGTPPFRYIATNCAQTFGPFNMPVGLQFDVITLDFDPPTGTVYGNSNVVRFTVQ